MMRRRSRFNKMCRRSLLALPLLWSLATLARILSFSLGEHHDAESSSSSSSNAYKYQTRRRAASSSASQSTATTLEELLRHQDVNTSAGASLATISVADLSALFWGMLSLQKDVQSLRRDVDAMRQNSQEQEDQRHQAPSSYNRDRHVSSQNGVEGDEKVAIVAGESARVLQENGEGTIPTATKSLLRNNTLWKNRYDVVHVVTTRFMVFQPDLVHLGKARLDIFETVTLPSFLHQTTQEFLWIIYTDPNLNPLIRDPLIRLVQHHPNIVLLGMNRAKFDDFRSSDWLDDVTTVFCGNFQLLVDYHQASQHRVLAFTRMDADDAGYLNLMQNAQQQASLGLGRTAKLAQYQASNLFPKQRREFLVVCSKSNLEWGYYNPWNNHTTRGHLYGQHGTYCVTAGLTYVFQIGFESPSRIIKPHYKLNRIYRDCNQGGSIHYSSDDNESVSKAIVPSTRKVNNCLAKFQLCRETAVEEAARMPSKGPVDGSVVEATPYSFATLRSRTPTSNGMNDVLTSQQMYQERIKWKAKQDETWDTVLNHDFGVDPQSIWNLRKRLEDNVEMIVRDSLQGQCKTTHKSGFSCKMTSRHLLLKLLRQEQERKRGVCVGGCNKNVKAST